MPMTIPGGGSPGGSDGQIQRNNAGAFAGSNLSQAADGTMAFAIGTLTTAVAPFSLSATYNNAGVTFPGVVQNVTDTASNSLSFLHQWQIAGSIQTAIYKSGDLFTKGLFTGTSTGGIRFSSTASGIAVRNAGYIGWSSDAVLPLGAPTMDVLLYRDAANTLAQRNGANAQAFRVYNTYTDGSNYEFGGMSWSGNVFTITALGRAGTGGYRNLKLEGNGKIELGFASGGLSVENPLTYNGHAVLRLRSNSTPVQLCSGDPTYDAVANPTYIEAQPAFPAAATNLVGGALRVTAGAGASSSAGVASGGPLLLDGGRGYGTGAHGMIVLGSLYERWVAFGGTTSSFPALKRSSTVLQARLADDSDFAPIQGRLRVHAAAAAETPTATHTLRVFDSAGVEYKMLCVAA